MKVNLIIYFILMFAYFTFIQCAKADNIHFNNDIYKFIPNSSVTESIPQKNVYYLGNENDGNWTKIIELYYYPENSNPIAFAKEADKEMESKDNTVLLKFIENKKQNKALLSYLQTGFCNGKDCFEHNIYKYEKSEKKGILVTRYVKRYFYTNKDDVTRIGKEVKAINDDLLEQLIISPVPQFITNR